MDGAMKRILVSRAVGQTSSLANALLEAGLEPVVRPSIEIYPIPNSLPDLSSEWIVFSSRNGLATFQDLGGRLDPEQKVLVASSSDHGAKFIKLARPDSHGIREFFACLAPTTITLLRGNLATSELPDDLAQQGHEVIDARIYETRFATWSEPLPSLWGAAFTSKSCVDSVMENALALQQIDLIRQCKRFAIGPMTATALMDHGIPPFAIASQPSIPDLVATIASEAKSA